MRCTYALDEIKIEHRRGLLLMKWFLWAKLCKVCQLAKPDNYQGCIYKRNGWVMKNGDGRCCYCHVRSGRGSKQQQQYDVTWWCVWRGDRSIRAHVAVRQRRFVDRSSRLAAMARHTQVSLMTAIGCTPWQLHHKAAANWKGRSPYTAGSQLNIWLVQETPLQSTLNIEYKYWRLSRRYAVLIYNYYFVTPLKP